MRKVILSLCMLFAFVFSVYAQTRQVTGKVVDKGGEALIGVSVSVKGATGGTSTDAGGNFKIKVPESGNVILAFKYLGFKNKEVSVGASSQLAVTLEDSATSLDEVVVIGYGTTTRGDLTQSVSSVGAKQLKDVPINSAEQAIAGRLAGVQVTATDGAPGADVAIRVRGGGSITQDNSPLYIVDGVQVENALRALSPQDIQTIDVLKDAASTAIYGARGANGVVIITTKGGKEGKTNVSYNGFFGYSNVLNKLDVLNATDYLKYQYERVRGTGLTGSADTVKFIQRYGLYSDLGQYKSQGIDWQEEVFGRTANQQTHNLSINGGNKGTTYNLSVTSNDQDGAMINSDYARKLLGFKFEHKANDKLKANFNVRYTDEKTNGAGVSSPGLARDNYLKNTVQYRPINANDDLDFYDQQYVLDSELRNPLINATEVYKKIFGKRLNLSGSLTFNFTKNLTARSTIGFDNNNIRTDQFFSERTGQAALYSNMPIASIGSLVTNTLNNSNTLTYNLKKWRKVHDLDILVGEETYQTNVQENKAETRYLPLGITADKALNNMNIGTPPTGAAQPRPTSNITPAGMLSFFSRINYGYDGKYLLTLTGRADGSSKFMKGKRWSYFPSAALAWRLSKEKFMEPISAVVNDAKIRLSYGTSGNNRINDFAYLTMFSPNTYYGLGEQLMAALTPTQLANPDLKWETTISRNLGADFSFFKDRITFTTDVYYNSTKDLLLVTPIPPTSGYTDQLQNIGATSNRGIEFQLNGTIVNTKKFNYTANFNMAFNRNKVEKLGSGITTKGYPSGWETNVGNDYLVEVGKPLGQIYGYMSDGFYPVSDFDYVNGAYVLKAGVPSLAGVDRNTIQPGTMKLKDLGGQILNSDGSPSITVTEDKRVIGNALPLFTGGFNQQFSYKNWDMNVFVNFSYGNDVYNANKIVFLSGYKTNNNLLESASGRFRTINDQGISVYNNPEALTELNKNATLWRPSEANYMLSDWAIEDGSFLRINNVTLGYTLPKALVTRAKISNLRFYATASNLATITGYSGFDPEVNTRSKGGLTPGVDYSAYPRSRTFVFGVNLTL